MPRYVDGFVLPLSARKLDDYRRMARRAGKIWMEHGALAFCECAGDDLDVKGFVPFPKLAKVKPGETVLFSWIVYKSKAHRDRVNAKVMSDPRLQSMMNPGAMPFDPRRVSMGGFTMLVDLHE